MKWITVSRKLGANGSEVARTVAGGLGYRFYDTAAIAAMAQRLGLADSVKEVDEKPPSIFQRLFSHRPTVYFDRLYSVIYELAKQGDAVFLGRGSNILLGAFNCALHVRVTASLERRIRTLTERGFSEETARRAIRQSDAERSAFVRVAFGADWEDPERYHLVLNMDKLSVKLAVSTVVQVARSREIAEASADALKSLERLGLAKRAEAALMEGHLLDERSSSMSVMVTGPASVRVEGFVDSAERRAEAERLLRAVTGVVSVENDIRVIQVPMGT